MKITQIFICIRLWFTVSSPAGLEKYSSTLSLT